MHQIKLKEYATVWHVLLQIYILPIYVVVLSREPLNTDLKKFGGCYKRHRDDFLHYFSHQSISSEKSWRH